MLIIMADDNNMNFNLTSSMSYIWEDLRWFHLDTLMFGIFIPIFCHYVSLFLFVFQCCLLQLKSYNNCNLTVLLFHIPILFVLNLQKSDLFSIIKCREEGRERIAYHDESIKIQRMHVWRLSGEIKDKEWNGALKPPVFSVEDKSHFSSLFFT